MPRRSNSVCAWPGSLWRIGLAMLSGMPPRAAHDLRVVHVDRVDQAVDRVRDLDLDAEAVEQLDERRVLALERRAGSGVRQPAPSQSPEVAGLRTRTRWSGATMDVTP